MKLADLSPETRRRIAAMRFDRIVEKHEGPWTWEYRLDHERVEFLTIDGYDVLLPIDKEQHPNISVVRCIVAEGRDVLTIFLTDTTYFTGMDAGFLAVCEKVPREEWYIALVYHEWFVIDDVSTQYRSASS